MSSTIIHPSHSLTKKVAPFRHILFETRDTRGGLGDVAPCLNTAVDLFERLDYNGKISFLVNEKSLYILRTILGIQNRFPQKIGLNKGTIHIHTLDSFDSSSSKIDLYIHLTSKHREGYHRNDLKDQRIPILPSGETVIYIQTGLGNLESLFKGPGKIEYKHKGFQIASAGLDKDNAGIYSDYDALLFRNKSQEEIRNHLLDKISEFKNQRWTKKLKGLLEGKYLNHALIGFAYGLHEYQAHEGLRQYLNGLKEYIVQQNRSAAIIIPALFGCYFLNSRNLPDFITVIEEDKSLPETAKSRQIYIVKCPILPPPLFNGFLAYSGLPPIITGSMALSSAILIGKPFVMALLSWNHRNIRALKNRLLDLCQYPKERNLINELYAASFREEKPNLSKSFSLLNGQYKRIFKELKNGIPNLTDHLMESASAVKAMELSGDGVHVVSSIKDPIFKWDILIKMSRMGDQQAFSSILDHYKKECNHPFQENEIDRLKELIQISASKKQPQSGLLRGYLKKMLRKTINAQYKKPPSARMKRFLVEAIVNLDMKGKKIRQTALDLLFEKIESQNTIIPQGLIPEIKALMDNHHVKWRDQVIFFKIFFQKEYHIFHKIEPRKKNNHTFLLSLKKILQKEYGYKDIRNPPSIPGLNTLFLEQSQSQKGPFIQAFKTKKIYFAYFLDSLSYPASIFASMAIAKGFQVDFGYHTDKDDEDTIEKRLVESSPDLVAISFFAPHRDPAFLVARVAKRLGIHVVAGGWYPTLQPDDLKESGYFDAVVKGDGTGIFHEILEYIKGFNGQVLQGKRHPHDAVYFQRYFSDTQKAIIKEKGIYEILSSIGCSNNFKACSTNHLELRVFPLNILIDSLEKAIVKYEINKVIIWDDYFTSYVPRLVEFRKNLMERPLNLSFIVHAQADSFSSGKAEELGKIGAQEIWFNTDRLFYRRKDFLKRFDSLFKSSQLCHEYGISFCMHLILGLPTQTEEDYKTLMNLLKRIRPHKINLSLCRPSHLSKSDLGKKQLPKKGKSFSKEETSPNFGDMPDVLATVYKERIENLVRKGDGGKVKILPLDDGIQISAEEIRSVI